MKKNVIILIAIILFAIVARFIYSAYGEFMQGVMRKKGALPDVTQGIVQEAKVLKQIDAPGRIVSKYRVDVMARIDGYLTKSYFKEGQFVKKGQVLFEIEPQEYTYNVQKAQANVNNTRAQLIYADKQLKRGSILVKKDYIAKAEYDNLMSNRDALKAQLAMYQAELRDASRNLGYTRVKSPVDGQIGIISVTVGNYVSTSAGALTTINSTNPIYVTFPIDSKEYLKLSQIDAVNVKRKVTLVFPTGDEYKLSGIQDFHDNNIDPTTGTITMRATFPNPEGALINGEFVKVTVYSKNTVKVPIVPQVAVLENQEGKYVYKLDDKGIPKIAIIKTAGQYKQNWIVGSGVDIGDKILVGGLQKVIPDQPVRIVNPDELKKSDKEQVKKSHMPHFLSRIKHKIKGVKK